MRDQTPIAVCSRSFSKTRELREALLASYSNVRFNDAGSSLRGQSLVEFLDGMEKAIVGLEVIDEALLTRLPALRVIAKYGVGLDRISFDALERHGVRLGWTGGVNRRAVAELVIANAINLLRGVVRSDRDLRAGTWQSAIGRELSQAVVGIIGCGNIGKEVVRLLQPFGTKVLAYDLVEYADFYAAFRVQPVDLATLLGTSDVVSLHVPLDNSTLGMLDRHRLALMKPDACLINTARGGLVDEDALYDMLAKGRLAGAAFDVFAEEPALDHRLFELDGFVGTPHLAGSTHRAVLAMGLAAIDGLR